MNSNDLQTMAPSSSEAIAGSVLIVDDDQNLCKAYKRILEKHLYRVQLAHTIQDADQLFSYWRFDAVLTDILLGSEDGLLVLKKSLDHRPETPVIVMTGEPTLQTATNALRLSAYDYLQKPISSRQLVHVVSRAVELNQLRSEKKRIEIENQYYQRNLERMVALKTAGLTESNERYELLFSNSRDAIYIAKPDDRFIALNQAFIDLTRSTRKELMKGSVRDLFDDPLKYNHLQREMLQNDYVKDFEFRLKRKGHSVIECLLTANLIRSPNKEITGHQGIIRDITFQKEAEQQIREQNKFLKNILESLTHPFMVIDAHDYSVRIANSAAVKSKVMNGHTCHEFRHGTDHPCYHNDHHCTLKEVIDTGRPCLTEHIISNKDGEQRKYEVNAFPLFNESGKIVQIIQYYIDITEKRRLEAIAEAANLMDNLGYIFSGIRHEIGNPLNSVKMALSVLSKNLNTYDRETISEFVHRCLSELSRVEYLLKSLKNFSLFETPIVESVNLKHFMDNFLSLVQDDFKRKEIRVTSDIAEDAVLIKIDHRALHQILLNLMTNSADALIDRADPEIKIAVGRERGWIQVQVIDNGCGISSDEMKHLFKPFVTSKPHGSGLGLVIVKKMVSKMDGSIKIDSRKDEGTTVTMFFPEGDSIDDQNVIGD